MKILFQGDSITDGGRGRTEDKNHIMGHCYAYIVAAKLGYEYFDKGFEFINKGVSGNTCPDLYARWQTDALNLEPNVISVLVGTNDSGQAVRSPKELVCDRFEVTLRLILQQTKLILPNTRFILMEPFLLDSGNFERDFIQTRMEILKPIQACVKDIAGETNSLFIPLQERFNEVANKSSSEYWLWDSVHPTYAGHGLIAEVWLEEAKGVYII